MWLDKHPDSEQSVEHRPFAFDQAAQLAISMEMSAKQAKEPRPSNSTRKSVSGTGDVSLFKGNIRNKRSAKPADLNSKNIECYRCGANGKQV